MKLSIVIVNYNVKNFLQQLLQSLFKSVVTFDYEVIVVDNNSVDGSVSMLENEYAGKIKLHVNKENLGFSKANNIGIKVSQGEFILLLNPDTILMEDTLRQMVYFLDTHTDAGAVGVKMIDGEGKFLPESKRGLPTPEVALYKMAGLSKLFPKSKTFGRYHLGFLDENQTYEVEVLSGACMMIRRNILEVVGLLDEDYFMYGEDIDLSFQIKKRGYKNFYYPQTNIIHFKGESTKKGSLNYVKLFYQAMLIFFDKNLSHHQNKGLILLIRWGIYIRAFAAGFFSIIQKSALPLADICMVFVGLFLSKSLWQNYIKVGEGITYFPEYYLINFSLYCAVWLIAVFLNGGYDYPLKKRNVVVGVLWGTLIIAAIYGFLPLEYRFSRGMIVTGALWTITGLLFLRWLRYTFRNEASRFWNNEESYIVVGNEEAVNKVNNFFKSIGLKRNFLGFVFPTSSKSKHYLGANEQMEEVIQIHHPDEIVFASGSVEYQEIIRMMAKLNGKVKFKIAPEGMESIIGSHSKNTSGDFYTLDIGFNLAQPTYIRQKRMLDLSISFLFTIFSPLLILFQKDKGKFLNNIFQVLAHKKTWIGFNSPVSENLPKIKPCVIPIHFGKKNTQKISSHLVENMNLSYAKEYSVLVDILMISKNITSLGG